MKKKIKIFFASSMEREESNELDAFIYDLSDKFERQYDVRLRPVHGDGMGLEEELRTCEMAFFVFFRKLGEHTRKQFETARTIFEKGGVPRIYTYFKKVPEEEKEGELRRFAKEFDAIFGHYYSSFTHLDTVKLRILPGIKLQEMDFVNLSVESGMCKVNGQDILPVEHLPEFANSSVLKKLKGELENLERTYCQMRPLYAKGVADKAFYREYADVCSRRQKLKDNIEELQGIIFNMSVNIVRDEMRGEITQRQKEAYRLFELGDYDGCMAVLDAGEINADFWGWEEKQKKIMKKKAGVFIQEHKTAIDVLKGMYHYKDRFAEIRQRYAWIIEVALEYQTEENALLDYTAFLYYQNDYKEAENVAKKAWELFDSMGENVDNEQWLRLNLLLARLYSSTQREAEAEKLFKRVAEIWERLAEQNAESYEMFLTGIYNELARLYSRMQRETEAEKIYKKAAGVQERLTEQNAEAYAPDLAMLYNNLAVLYGDTQREAEAEKLFKSAAEIWERLVEQNAETYEPDLAMLYNNLANLYSDTQREAEAEELYKQAVGIRKRMAGRNAEAYEPVLANTYNNLAVLYSDTQRQREAEELYKKAVEIQERLAERNAEAYELDLLRSYCCLVAVILDSETDRYFDIKTYQDKVIKISKKHPQNYLCKQILDIFERSNIQ